MPIDHDKLMGALLAAAAMAMFLQPLATPHAHARLERALASLTWEKVAALNACSLGEGIDCSQIPVP
jgi:hypothetical protein